MEKVNLLLDMKRKLRYGAILLRWTWQNVALRVLPYSLVGCDKTSVLQVAARAQGACMALGTPKLISVKGAAMQIDIGCGRKAN